MDVRTARGIPMGYGEIAWKETALQSLITGAFTAIGAWFAMRYLIKQFEKKKPSNG